MITWDCDLDYDPKHCLPDYSFLRLDDPDARVAQGFNFRSLFINSSHGKLMATTILWEREEFFCSCYKI